MTAESVSASYDAGVLSVRVAGAYAGTGAHTVEITTGTPAVEATSETTETTGTTETTEVEAA